LLFEPLPFVTGLIFLAFLGKYLLAGELDRFHLIKIMVYVPGAFLLTHLVLLGTLGFDILAAFSFAMDDARSFNATTGRSYRLWVVHNLKDFFLNMGIAQSALFVISLGAANWKVATLLLQRTGTRGEFRAYLLRNDVVLLMAFSLVLLVLDLLGVNRGETIRLWIFLGVILQIVAARYCAVGRRFWVFALVLALTILQAALCLSAVAFSWPDQVGEEFIRRYMGS